MNDFLRVIVLFFLSFFLTSGGYAQDLLKKELQWYTGELKLSKNESVQGELSPSLRYETVQFRLGGDSSTVNSYSANKVDYFKFFDIDNEIERVFYALPYKDFEGMSERTGFFELIKDYNDFALLSKSTFNKAMSESVKKVVLPMVFLGTNIRVPIGDIMIEKIKLYFINRKGELLSIGIIKPGYSNATIYIESRKHYIDKNSLKKVLGNRYSACIKYAKQEKLKLDRLGDLLVVLDYSQSMSD